MLKNNRKDGRVKPNVSTARAFSLKWCFSPSRARSSNTSFNAYFHTVIPVMSVCFCTVSHSRVHTTVQE